MTPELLAAALEHARAEAPRESCGLVLERYGKAVYRACRNTSLQDDMVRPDPLDLMAAEDEGRVLGFVHSHPDGDLRFSQTDHEGAEAMALPWWVVAPGTGGWRRYDPASRPLLGRQFVFGVDDCWSICRDWYGQWTSLEQPDFVRADGFWEAGEEPHLAHLAEAGFQEVGIGGLKEGDGLLFRTGNRTVQHCGVYIGSGRFLHHMEMMLSQEVQLNERWMNRLVKVVRRTS